MISGPRFDSGSSGGGSTTAEVQVVDDSGEVGGSDGTDFDTGSMTLGTTSGIADRVNEAKNDPNDSVTIETQEGDTGSSPAGGAGLVDATARFTGAPEEAVSAFTESQGRDATVDVVNAVTDAREAQRDVSGAVNETVDDIRGLLGKTGPATEWFAGSFAKQAAVAGVGAVLLGGAASMGDD